MGYTPLSGNIAPVGADVTSIITQFLQTGRAGQIDLSKIRNSDLLQLQKMLTPKITKFIPHTPTPKQTAFLLLDNKEAFYGGAAGGGKSDALLMAGLQYVDVPGYAGIIFRKSYADLTKPGALIDRSHEWLGKFPEDCRWVDKEKKWEFFSKAKGYKEVISILQFGYMENYNDRLNYQGGEYQFIGFDELTHFGLDNYLYLFSRLRRLKNTYIPLRVRGASNPPDDDQGMWVKKRFIDEGVKHNRIFIPAGLDDNPYLDRAEYEESLNVLDPVLRKRLRDGDWQITRKGNMFKREWFQVVDVLPPNRKRLRWWDMAATDEEASKKKNKSGEPDFTVGFLLSEYDGIFYIEDIVHERLAPAGTEQLQKNTAISDGYSTVIREEQEPGSAGIGVTDNKKRHLFMGYNYDAIKSTGNKAQRASLASAAAEHGLIKIYKNCRNIEEFYLEAEIFPGGIHDDMVDGLSGSYNILSQMPITCPPLVIEKASQVDSHWASEDDLGCGYFSDFGR